MERQTVVGKGSKQCVIDTVASEGQVLAAFEDALLKKKPLVSASKWKRVTPPNDGILDGARVLAAVECVPTLTQSLMFKQETLDKGAIGTVVALAVLETGGNRRTVQLWTPEYKTYAGLRVGGPLVAQQYKAVARRICAIDPDASVHWI